MKCQVLIHCSDQVQISKVPDLKKLLRMMANDHGWDSFQISIAMLSDAEIREINKEFLEHDYATDVISFNLGEEDDVLEGEIVVSVDTARTASEEVGWRLEDELTLYVIHGMLHILGYRDGTLDEKNEMRFEERHYLEAMQITGWERHPSRGDAEPDSQSSD